MPFKTDKISINCPFLDKRTKLLPCQKEMVVHYHQQGFSQRKLAAMFNVSRRLIQFLTDPDKQLKNLEARRDRGGSMAYYDKKKHRDYVKKHRRNKYEKLKDTL